MFTQDHMDSGTNVNYDPDFFIYIVLDGKATKDVVWADTTGKCKIIITEIELSKGENKHYFEIIPHDESYGFDEYNCQIKEMVNDTCILDFTTSKTDIIYDKEKSIAVRSSFDTAWVRAREDRMVFHLDVFTREFFMREENFSEI